jgi:hypothetical protein
MKKPLFILFISLSVIAQSCSDLKVTTDYDKTADFSDFKTFNILSDQEGSPVPNGVSKLTLSNIEESIIDQMMNRGYTLSDNPDIGVYYYIKLSEQTQYVQSSVGYYGGSPYYYGYYGGYGYYDTYVQAVNSTEGSLIIELVDVKKNRALWQGIATQSVTASTATEKSIAQIVNSIFFSYKWKAETSSTDAPKSNKPVSNQKTGDQ